MSFSVKDKVKIIDNLEEEWKRRHYADLSGRMISYAGATGTIESIGIIGSREGSNSYCLEGNDFIWPEWALARISPCKRKFKSRVRF